MKTPSRHFGVSFCAGKIQIAELQLGKTTSVLALAEGDTTLDVSQAAVNLTPDHPQASILAQELGDLLRRNKIGAKTVSFALPTDPLFVNIVPVDETIKGKKFANFVRWEVQQYYPDLQPKDFVIGAAELGSRGTGGKPTCVVAVRKGIIGFLRKVSSDLRLKVDVIDIDQFCAEKTLAMNYPEVRKNSVVLFGLRYSGVDASLLREGEMYDYRSFNAELPTELPKVVHNYLKYIQYIDSIDAPRALFFAGMDVDSDVLAQLQTETDTQTISLNALRKIPVTGKIYEPFLKGSSRFAAAIGLSLRTE
ncbi:MAG: hypothetical protein WD295_02915 [Bacteroidota bacterium]